MALAFPTRPDHAFSFLFSALWAPVALIPLFVAVGRGTHGEAFRTGWQAGFVFNLASLYWVAFTQGGGPAVVAGTVCMAAYLGLYWGGFTFLLVACTSRWGWRAWAAAPPLWTAFEYALSLGELGFPWMLLGHSQAGYPAAIQYAEYTGVYGVSFWIVAVNVLLFGLATGDRGRTRRMFAAGAVAVLATPLLYGWAVVPPPASARTQEADREPARETAPDVRVGLVQNNMGRSKWRPGGLERSFESLERLTRAVVSAAPGEVDLVIWPETALPCYLAWRAGCRARLRDLVVDTGTPVLTGASGLSAATGEPTNAAFLVADAHSVPASYAKMHLVPFGERTPFRDSIPFLRDIDWTALTGDLGPAEFARGRERTLFLLPRSQASFAVLICFESVFPDFVRRSVAAGAEFIVVITNDSWFGRTAGPYQHAQLAVMRAVETRRAIARCATSGISLFVDPYGRASGHTPVYAEAIAAAELPRSRVLTFYTRHGDLFAQLNVAVAVLLACLLVARARDKF